MTQHLHSTHVPGCYRCGLREDVPDGYTLTPDTCDTCRDSIRTADAVLALLEGGGDE